MIKLKVNKQNAKKFNEKLKNMQKFLSNQGNYSDQTLFKTYCNYFRQVCNEIGSLIRVSNFKGSNQEILNFYGSNEYKTEKGVQLAIALDTTKKLCQYQAEKLNIYNQWFDKCWENILIKLGILTKPLAQYTIGESIFIPYNDTSNVITSPIEFQVVGINHHKENSLTLMTKNIIRFAAFDAKEPNNTDSNKANHGNTSWSLSNIRQWLNSTKGANQWWSPTHDYDAEPTEDNIINKIYNNTYIGDIANSPGFLNGFSSEILQHFATVQNVTALPSIDGDGYETTQDKVFLASYAELFGTNNNIEGNHLSEKFVDNESRIKKFNGESIYYWTRNPWVQPNNIVVVSYYGYYDNSTPCYVGGCAPLVVLI